MPLKKFRQQSAPESQFEIPALAQWQQEQQLLCCCTSDMFRGFLPASPELSMHSAAALCLVALAESSRAFNFAASSVDFSARRGTRSTQLVALGGLFEMLKPKKIFDAPCVMGDESVMAQKAHGTSTKPVQNKLRWGCKVDLADRICSFNRCS